MSNASNSSESSDSSDPGLLRHDWEKIEQISDVELKQMLTYQTGVDLAECHIGHRSNGGFNHIVFMSTVVGARQKHYVVRSPSVGTQERWQKGDAHNMDCKVSLLQYLYQETRVTLPHVIAFEPDIKLSSIGASFVLMECLPGQPSQCLWYDDPSNRNYATTSNVSSETEAKRRNMLRSLARIMPELQSIKFDQIGMPHMFGPDGPQATTAYKWKVSTTMTTADLECDTQVVDGKTYRTSKDYTTHDLDENWFLNVDPEYGEDTLHMCWGIRKILDIIYAQPTITASKSKLKNGGSQQLLTHFFSPDRVSVSYKRYTITFYFLCGARGSHDLRAAVSLVDAAERAQPL